jgi:hypothetical protein
MQRVIYDNLTHVSSVCKPYDTYNLDALIRSETCSRGKYVGRVNNRLNNV